MITNFEDGGKIIRMMTDANQSVFRYGLHLTDDSYYEDPTYLGFTIEIDQDSALFTQVLPFLEKHSSERKELAARIPVYKEFINKITMMFNSQESVSEDHEKAKFIKQHYINSIGGLNNLSKKYNVWKEDKLTLELYEDISLFSSYIVHLNNNLVFSYQNGRELMPENLLKFNLYIKISEVRNLTSVRKLVSNNPNDLHIANALKNNVTAIVYKLYDCQFDFMESRAYDDEMAIAGIDGAIPPDALLNMDLYFKSVSRQIYNPLIRNSISMNDNIVDLDVLIVGTSGDASPSGQTVDPSGNLIGENNSEFQQMQVDSTSNYNKQAFLNDSRKSSTIKNESLEGDNISDNEAELNENSGLVERRETIEKMKKYNDQYVIDYDLINQSNNIDRGDLDMSNLPGQTGSYDRLGNLTDKLKNTMNNTVSDAKNKITNKLQQKRNELKRQFVGEIKNKIGIDRISPDNVNDVNALRDTLNTMKNKLGNSIFDDVIKTIT